MQQLLLLLLVGLGLASSLALADRGDPLSQYRVLEWQELVPEGWEPPLIPVAHDQVEKVGTDPGSVVDELAGQLIALPGFMKPLVYEGNSVSAFLLVPYLQHHITQHSHLDSNQMVHVSLLEPFVVSNPLQPVWVVGAISLEPVFTDEGQTAYSIGNAVVTEYEY